MVFFDHFLFDAGFMFRNAFVTDFGVALANFAYNYQYSTFRLIFNPIEHFVFFSLSGIVTSFSRSGIKRPIKYTAVALLITLVTFILQKIMGGFFLITFGVIFAFAVSAFIAYFLDKLKTNKWILLAVGLILSFVGIMYIYGGWTFLAEDLFFLFYTDNAKNLTADYFPIFPYVGYFLIGMFLGKILYKEKKPYIKFPPLIKKATGWIAFLGKTSLWWYLLSQVVFYGIFSVVTYFGVL
jgi:uncharacterized membrane protein